MITLKSHGQVEFNLDPDDYPSWIIYETQFGKKIGSLEVNLDGIFVGADISLHYQRKGIATKAVQYLVEEYDYQFFFWPPDGQTYDDARHLSVEGAKLANSLISKGLAQWVNPYDD